MPTETARQSGYLLARGVLDAAEVDTLRAGVEAAVRRIVAVAAAEPDRVHTSHAAHGHRLQSVRSTSMHCSTSIHWEPGEVPAVRNLRPVTHLDQRLHAMINDSRLTGPAAELLGVAEVGLLTSKISFKRAGVGSEFDWHQDFTFLERFLGPAATQVVTAMVLLDDADAGNGALRLIPGSHLGPPRPDGEPPRPGDAAEVVIEAAAGSVVLFPTLLVHSSGANTSDRDRRALLLLYQPADRPQLSES